MLSSHASFSLALAASWLSTQVQAHTYLIQPKTRLAFAKGFGDSLADGTGSWDGLCHLGDGTPTCCNTAQIPSGQQETYTRGQEVQTHWWRNNHAGGFTRYSIVPIDQSDSQAAFDDASNVRSYGCNSVGCDQTYNGDSPNNWNGGDSNGNKGWSNVCSGSFKVPYDLKDGTYTLQWIWWATGNAPSANSPFQGCVDFKISGGPTGAKPKCPLWKGGDLSEKSKNACSYVSVNNPTYQGVCASANACQGSYQVGVPKAIQACYSGQTLTTYPLEMVSAPSGFPDTYTSYKPSGKSSSNSSSSSSSSDSKKSTSKSTSKSSSSTKTTDKSSANVKVDSKATSSKTKSSKCMRKRSHSRRAHVRFHNAQLSS